MPKIVAFTGRSNSGKTTLIEKIIQTLACSYKVAVFKHDPKNKAVFDTEGKDSYRFFHQGADVAVVSPSKTTIIAHQNKEIDWLCRVFFDKDYIFVEGLKELSLPRICVARDMIDVAYIDFSDAFAIDTSVCNLEIIPKNIPILDLNNPNEVLLWINKFGKEISG
ncbi:molybdopterin-guanine dinucleotide biosynthesis protein B [Helicobacter sp. 12S02232-10]|uniref:molybdopterin-guanine dinucleotide biosynthesis protein B n=1 Tax=Helicobacter sp. 12S02232-10 TaxID=1476197 RepID=UPI000BA6CC86|nr:molybdopterin-guanine dinucleotide biosynthesis protein B [Helicobacter sp. 12S02232-10]PAF46396.1 molybdopterin-guanine dinucleotide biosynthesis protein B [Helicobacter sp. 12S02232-10]